MTNLINSTSVNESPDVKSKKGDYPILVKMLLSVFNFLAWSKVISRAKKNPKSFNMESERDFRGILLHPKKATGSEIRKFPNVGGLFIQEIVKALRWLRKPLVMDEKEYEYWVLNGGERIRVVEKPEGRIEIDGKESGARGLGLLLSNSDSVEIIDGGRDVEKLKERIRDNVAGTTGERIPIGVIRDDSFVGRNKMFVAKGSGKGEIAGREFVEELESKKREEERVFWNSKQGGILDGKSVIERINESGRQQQYHEDVREYEPKNVTVSEYLKKYENGGVDIVVIVYLDGGMFLYNYTKDYIFRIGVEVRKGMISLTGYKDWLEYEVMSFGGGFEKGVVYHGNHGDVGIFEREDVLPLLMGAIDKYCNDNFKAGNAMLDVLLCERELEIRDKMLPRVYQVYYSPREKATGRVSINGQAINCYVEVPRNGVEGDCEYIESCEVIGVLPKIEGDEWMYSFLWYVREFVEKLYKWEQGLKD